MRRAEFFLGFFQNTLRTARAKVLCYVGINKSANISKFPKKAIFCVSRFWGVACQQQPFSHVVRFGH